METEKSKVWLLKNRLAAFLPDHRLLHKKERADFTDELNFSNLLNFYSSDPMVITERIRNCKIKST